VAALGVEADIRVYDVDKDEVPIEYGILTPPVAVIDRRFKLSSFHPRAIEKAIRACT
jgi:hypothetical protein